MITQPILINWQSHRSGFLILADKRTALRGCPARRIGNSYEREDCAQYNCRRLCALCRPIVKGIASRMAVISDS